MNKNVAQTRDIVKLIDILYKWMTDGTLGLDQREATQMARRRICLRLGTCDAVEPSIRLIGLPKAIVHLGPIASAIRPSGMQIQN